MAPEISGKGKSGYILNKHLPWFLTPQSPELNVKQVINETMMNYII